MDTLERLDEEIASLSAQMNVVTYRLLAKIREFDERQGWAGQGYLSCVQYLSFRIGLAPSCAREKVRVAHALATLPKIAAAMASGALSYSKVRALTRIATAKDEEDLLAAANEVSAAALERIVRGVRRVETGESLAKKEEARGVSFFTDHDGMIVIQCRLLAEEGAIVRKALSAIELPKAPIGDGKRMADALVRVAERSLAGSEGSAADRHQVIVHVDAEVLAGGDGRAEIGGIGASAEAALRLACDASVVTMTHDKDGAVVEVGRKTRTISTPMRRKLKERDGETCRFPGCTNRYTDGHHVKHWAHGGETTLENLVSLCRTHHRFVHDFGYAIAHDSAGRFVFKDNRGRPLPNAPAPIAPAEAALHAPAALPQQTPPMTPPMPCYARIPDLGYVVSHLRS